MAEDVTTKLKVDISDLKKSMQEAKAATALAKSEFNEAASSCDDWTKSSDALSSKLDSLKTTLNEQKTKLALLNKEYELACAEQGEASTAAQRLKVQINNQQAAVNRTQKSIDGYEQSLTEVQKAERISKATGKEVAEVLEEMGNKAEEASDGFTVMKGAVATFAGNMLTGFANAIKNGISNVMNLAEETREFRSEMAKLDTAFTTNGHSAEAANKTYQGLYAVLGDEGQAVEAANHLALLTDNEEELANWTKIATGVYGTFGASLPIEGLTEAANETAKVGQVTGPLADALNWAGVSEDKFNESLAKCSTEQERQKLIMDTLNGLYSDAATKFEETNASVIAANEANARYQETMATLGAKIEPITTALKNGFSGILEKVIELVEGVDMTAFTAKIEEAFKVLSEEVLPAVMDGFQWILDNKDTLIAGLAGIAAGFVAFKVASLINSVVTAFQAFKAANEGATIAQWLLNAAMNANPMMLIVTIVAAVIAAIVAFVATNDKAREAIVKAWNAVTEFVGKAIDAIVKFFTETIPKALAKMVNFFKELPGKIWTWLSNVISKVATWASNMASKAKEAASNFINKVVEFVKQLPGKVWTWLVNVVSKVGEWAGNLAAKGKEAAQKLLTTIVDKVKEIPGKMLEVGKNLVQGLWDGINNAVDWLKSKISGFVGNVTDWLKEFFKIGSPSKLMADEVGKWLPEGIAFGIDKNAKSVLSSMRDLTKDTVLTAKNGLTSAAGTLGVSGGGARSVVFNQTINSPKQLDRLTLYRQSKNLLNYAAGGAS